MIPDSMNPRQMAENILELQRQIKEAGSELPTPGVGDTGKILKVGASGYELGNELVPTPTVADENKIIKVNSEGAYTLATEYSYTPPAYSETEYDTGKLWVDGRKVYGRVLSGTVSGDSAVSFSVNYTQLVRLEGVTDSSTAYDYNAVKLLNVVGNVQRTLISVSANTTYAGLNFFLTVEYLKDDPPSPTPDVTPSPDDGNRSVPEENNEEPVEEVKTTRKRSTSSK